MAWDLQISNLNDLVFAGNRDLSFVRSADLVSQRIMVRLKIPRGSFLHNPNLGSELRTLLHSANSIEWQIKGTSIVAQALKPMEDLSVQAVEVKPDEDDPRSVIVVIEGVVTPERTNLTATFKTEIPLPLAPAPSETTARA